MSSSDPLALKESQQSPTVVAAIRPTSRRSRRLAILAVCATAAFFVGQWSRPLFLQYTEGESFGNALAGVGGGGAGKNQAPIDTTTTVLDEPPRHDDAGAPPSKPKSRPRPKPQTPLAPHRYRTDGLLEVNPDGGHPVLELVSKAEQAWAEKFKKQSWTLEDAVDEYYRRYKRFPPKGFDKW